MRILLLPFSWIWSVLLILRNFLYNKGWLRSFEFDFPIILVGNLSTGGTGKTPHVEYLIRLLKKDRKVATLSRGYKRQMQGYGLATELSLTEDIGDEPKLFKQKYPDVEVAVDENRVEGVYYLLNDEPDVRVIIMDDGFQHRRIKAGFNIILTAYDHSYYKDFVLPAGNLREPRAGARRADCVIVTRCPVQLSEAEKTAIENKLHLTKDQRVYFTSLHYGEITPLFKMGEEDASPSGDEIFLLTGIANNRSLTDHLSGRFHTITPLKYPDHHYFSEQDLRFIQKKAGSGCIITTEKDAMRLMEQEELIRELGLHIWVIPIEVKFLADGDRFDQQLADFLSRYPIAAT